LPARPRACVLAQVVQYHYALEALKAQAAKQHNSPSPALTDVYMVGDNPASDMQGPRNMNAAAAREPRSAALRWHGALVRTGVYAHGRDDPNGASLIAADVAEAVDVILARHGLDGQNRK